MKFSELIFRLKTNKFLMGLFIGIICLCVFDLFVIIFDVIELIQIQANVSFIASSFVWVNAIAIAVNLIMAVAIVVLKILKRI